LPDVDWTSQSPQATSPSLIARQSTRTSPGPWPLVTSHVFGPSTTQVDPDIPYRESRQTTHQPHTDDFSTALHWLPRELSDFAAPSEVREVSQRTVRPTVGISASAIAPLRAVNVDTRVERLSSPHFVASDTRRGQFSPIVAPNSIHVDVRAASPSLSRIIDSDTRSKRLYAATHAPLAPPTTPIVDLLCPLLELDLECHERDILSSSSDSDYPPASQRENRPPLLGTHLCSPSGLSEHSTTASTDALRQRVQLTSQLAATVQQQLERTQTEAAQREHRMFNDIAEREHRLLAHAADREHALLKDAASVGDVLLAHDQHAREIEAERERRLLDDAQQRERDLRRDMSNSN